MSITISISYTV